MADKDRINGNQYEWSSLTIKIKGEIYTGIVAVNYTDKRERGKAYGQGKSYAPRGRTGGKYSAEGSIEMWKSSWQDLKNDICKIRGDTNYGEQIFDVDVQYTEEDETPCHDVLHDCVIAEVADSNAEGTDPLKVSITLDVMYIKTGNDDQTLFFNDGSR